MNPPRTKKSVKGKDLEANLRSLTISWPWWVHPAWALLLLTGTTAILAVILSEPVYETWEVRKFLSGDLSLVLLIGVIAAFAGIMFMAGSAARGGSTKFDISPEQVKFLRRAHAVMFVLALCSYVVWIGSAASQGVSVTNLASVLNRDPGAISSLKGNSRPIGGLTTLTQLAPVVVVVGHILRKLGHRTGRATVVLIVLAGVRTVFYAERLALIEVLIPLLLIAALTIRCDSKWRKITRLAPLIVAPFVWVIFAVSEYTRSWIFYQQTTNLPFVEWVSARLAGYYVTSFNNSALLTLGHQGSQASPYFTFPAFWNAPGAPAHEGIYGLQPDDWWASLLSTEGNEEFNNPGSFLVTYAELGTFGMIAFWIITGSVLGALFAAMTRGSLPGLIASCALFVGILELPRFIYWTQGRATPILLALMFIAITYPRRRLNQVPLRPENTRFGS